jgi:hypothetical protein
MFRKGNGAEVLKAGVAMSAITLFKLVHLLGLVGGFGAAALADFLVLRKAILRPIDEQLIAWLTYLSRIAIGGLILLWLSGIALIAVRYSEGAAILTNEKVWAKVVIVILLTVNGVFVHHLALKRVAARVGTRLFDSLPFSERAGLSLIAAISSMSWMFPFVLGTASELNHKVSVGTVLGVYALLVMLAWMVILMGINWLFPLSARGHALAVPDRFIMDQPEEISNPSRDEIHDKYVDLLRRVRAMSAQSF